MEHHYDYVYDKIFDEYKEFMLVNSKYSPKVVKNYNQSATYFPMITCILSNNTDTEYCSNDKIEKYEAFYFTIDIYTKNKTKGVNVVTASEMINEELSRLTMEFFGGKLNMNKTLNQPTPNADTSIYRKTIRYQCLIGNIRGNIIRR